MSTITINQAIDELSTLLDQYEWFYDCVAENKRVIVVYVDSHLVAADNQKAYGIIPDALYGYQVKVWSHLHAECEKRFAPLTLEQALKKFSNQSTIDEEP